MRSLLTQDTAQMSAVSIAHCAHPVRAWQGLQRVQLIEDHGMPKSRSTLNYPICWRVSRASRNPAVVLTWARAVELRDSCGEGVNEGSSHGGVGATVVFFINLIKKGMRGGCMRAA